jgi:hypothetical protein
VRVLARRRNFDRARPVEVEVAERKGQVLQLHLRETRVVLWHVEMGRQDTALVCGRGCQEKVELLAFRSLVFHETFVDDAAAWGILGTTLAVEHEEPLRDSFVDDHHRDLGCDCRLVVELVDGSFELRDLRLQNLVSHRVADAVSVDDEVGGELACMVLRERVDCLADGALHVVLHNFLSFLLNQEVAVVLTHISVDACGEANN